MSALSTYYSRPVDHVRTQKSCKGLSEEGRLDPTHLRTSMRVVLTQRFSVDSASLLLMITTAGEGSGRTYTSWWSKAPIGHKENPLAKLLWISRGPLVLRLTTLGGRTHRIGFLVINHHVLAITSARVHSLID